MFSLTSLFHRIPYRTLNQVTLSRSALLHNLRFFQDHLAPTQVAPVLKSNAYGHGLSEVAQLLDDQQLPFLIVDSLYEAYELQKQHLQTPILIMGFTHPDNFKVKRLPFHTVVYDLELIEVLARYQPQMKLHLKIDTGMNRQGVKYAELESFLQQLKRFPHLNIEGVCTHLSDSNNSKDNSFTELQLSRFIEAIHLLQKYDYHPKWRHIAATAGAFKTIHPEVNLIRLGIGLYGISNLDESDPVSKKFHLNQLHPVLQFETTLAQIKHLQKGETVGYDNTYQVKKDLIAGILPVGYYDGVDRRLLNTKGKVTIDGIECPIIGRVSMNITVVDISQVPHPKVGQQVIVYSRHPKAENSVAQVAKTCQTIPYEILVHLAESVKRVVEK